MDFVRNFVDSSYNAVKPIVFRLTGKDPEIAHETFIYFAQAVHKLGLEEFLLDFCRDQCNPGFSISTAAGFNKNGDIPSSFLRCLGFDRNVIGTVTSDSWEGNERPRIRRYPATESLVNWMGLPGIGADGVARNLGKYNEQYGIEGLALTVSLMSTPGKQGREALDDIRRTMRALKDFSYIDRWEPNFSCPNTKTQSGALDARKEYQEMMAAVLDVVNEEKREDQEVYVKVSPDLSLQDIEQTFATLVEKRARGVVATNTTTFHDACYIAESPGKGGASGNAVYEMSIRVQRAFADLISQSGSKMEIIACGGINSLERARERTTPEMKAREIQIYTPLIFRGPRLLKELRKYC